MKLDIKKESLSKSTNELIIINNITKKFKKTMANDKISFVIKKGEKIGIVGSNGAGKTTLIEQIVGVSKPTNGSIKYNFSYDNTPQEKMGIQFQDSSYPEGLTVRDIVNFSLDIYKVKIDYKNIQEILDIFQMKSFYKRRVKGLSGGQQQKLNVLLALIHKPEIIILDEISTGLDIEAKYEIFKYVTNYVANPNVTLILVSHNMDEIKKLCDRIIVLSNGKIASDMQVKDVIKKHNSLALFVSKIIKGVI